MRLASWGICRALDWLASEKLPAVACDHDDEVVEGRRARVRDVEVEPDLAAEGHLLDVVGGRADQRAENNARTRFGRPSARRSDRNAERDKGDTRRHERALTTHLSPTFLPVTQADRRPARCRVSSLALASTGNLYRSRCGRSGRSATTAAQNIRFPLSLSPSCPLIPARLCRRPAPFKCSVVSRRRTPSALRSRVWTCCRSSSSSPSPSRS